MPKNIFALNSHLNQLIKDDFKIYDGKLITAEEFKIDLEKALSFYQIKLNDNQEIKVGVSFSDPYLLFLSCLTLWQMNRIPVILSSSDSDNILAIKKGEVDVDLIINFNFLNSVTESNAKLLDFDPKDSHYITFTSGTTGKPKGVKNNFQSIINNCHAFKAFYKTNNEVILVNLPHYHISGIMSIFRGFINSNPLRVEKDIAEILTEKNQIISLVPKQIVDLDDKQLSSLARQKLIILGGQRPNDKVLNLIDKFKLPISITYGMTETAALVLGTRPFEKEIIPINCQYKIINGALAIKSNSLFSGYYIDGKFNPISFDEDFFVTSDLAQIEDGILDVTGRADNIFISGGVNISPDMILKEVELITEINHSNLISIEDQSLGHASVLFYNSDLTPVEIKNILSKRLHPHLIPKYFIKYSRHEQSLKDNINDLRETAERELSFRKLNYKVLGDKELPALFIFHGFMGSSIDFEFLKNTSNKYCLYFIDHPGHGSNKELNYKNMNHYITDLLGMIKHSYHQNKFALGYSLGGRVLAQILANSPSLFDHSIIESASLGVENELERKQRYKSDLSLFDQVNSDSDLTNFLTKWYSMPLFGNILKHINSDKLFNKTVADLKWFDQSMSFLSVGKMPYVLEQFKAINNLTYISGKLDTKYNEIGCFLNNLNPKINHIQVEECGHNIHFEQEALFTKIINDTLKCDH